MNYELSHVKDLSLISETKLSGWDDTSFLGRYGEIRLYQNSLQDQNPKILTGSGPWFLVAPINFC